MHQRHGGRNLVDVLAAWAGRPGETFLEIGHADTEPLHADLDGVSGGLNSDRLGRGKMLLMHGYTIPILGAGLDAQARCLSAAWVCIS